jgi:hypothetical protein
MKRVVRRSLPHDAIPMRPQERRRRSRRHRRVRRSRRLRRRPRLPHRQVRWRQLRLRQLRRPPPCRPLSARVPRRCLPRPLRRRRLRLFYPIVRLPRPPVSRPSRRLTCARWLGQRRNRRSLPSKTCCDNSSAGWMIFNEGSNCWSAGPHRGSRPLPHHRRQPRRKRQPFCPGGPPRPLSRTRVQ